MTVRLLDALDAFSKKQGCYWRQYITWIARQTCWTGPLWKSGAVSINIQKDELKTRCNKLQSQLTALRSATAYFGKLDLL